MNEIQIALRKTIWGSCEFIKKVLCICKFFEEKNFMKLMPKFSEYAHLLLLTKKMISPV